MENPIRLPSVLLVGGQMEVACQYRDRLSSVLLVGEQMTLWYLELLNFAQKIPQLRIPSLFTGHRVRGTSPFSHRQMQMGVTKGGARVA